MSVQQLSNDYLDRYAALLGVVGTTSGVEPDDLVAFWPMIGRQYDRELLVVGRAVNGWSEVVSARSLADPGTARLAAEMTRANSEGGESCPLGWVVWAWGRPLGDYSTARSAFWRLVRSTLTAVDPGAGHDPAWSSRLAWSNLAKVAPAAGGNPGGRLLELQRELGPALLATEVAELRPHRVLVMAGRWWFEPFANGLGIDVDWREGLVEGVGESGGVRWVIAPHPQGKPRALRDEVIAAFEGA